VVARAQFAVASMGDSRRCSVTACPAMLRAGGVFQRPAVQGPGGPGPTLPEPGRRRRPERPRRGRALPEWLQHLIRAISVGSGASTLAALVYQSADPAMNAVVDMALGMPGTLLIGMLAIILVAVGVGD
jgi:hypothetical protein